MNRTDMDRAATGGRPYNPETHRRRSIRLKDYDYSYAGAYFATICTRDRACLFGDVAHGEMRLNEYGHIVREEWFRSAAIRPGIELHMNEFVVMPNHVHGIVWIVDIVGATRRVAPTGRPHGPQPGTIGAIIGQCKSVTTKRINNVRNTRGISVWQRNYYEHVIRNEESLNRIRQYVAENPLQWAMDRENPVGATRWVAPTRDEPWRI